MDTGARRRSRRATPSKARSSPSDSTLKVRTPFLSPSTISSSVFPTPENTILSAGTPAAKARSSSPPETMSAPAPRRARAEMTARFEFAFIA